MFTDNLILALADTAFMKKTLVLVVDRDDDFGVKGKVNTPVVGVQPCLDAATALGIADPEDSDLNALYAAVSTCLELQEDGLEANVALICGDEKVGYKSDLALVSQLDEVMDLYKPDSVILVGDGAEDEYIYPIISSRANVDSVRKVYVKQAPGVEGTYYIVSRMLSDPGKRKRFLLPLGLAILAISLIFIIPNLMVYYTEGDIRTLAGMSGSLTVFIIGLVLVLYAYNVLDRMTHAKDRTLETVSSQSIRVMFAGISATIFLICMYMTYTEMESMYSPGWVDKIIFLASNIVWPATLSLFVYMLGIVIQSFHGRRNVSVRMVVSFINIVALAMVASGILDLINGYILEKDTSFLGFVEVISGVAIALILQFLTNRYRPEPEVEADEVFRLGAGLQARMPRHGVRSRR